MFFIRGAVILVFISAGYFIGRVTGHAVEGAIAGGASGVLALIIERILASKPMGSIIGGVIGLAFGLLASNLLLSPFEGLIEEGMILWGAYMVNALFAYGGMLVGLKKGEGLTVASLIRAIKGKEPEENKKILDTSVIIDGRIADVCETAFLEGDFIVPQFILHELQHIADSPDSLKRARGRRGLDILQRIQKIPHIKVTIVDNDFPKIKEVDSKLVALGKAMNAKVITNDFNLNKVAELQGVTVLNINELANAIKPVVLPGENLKVFIIKEGKEHNQGVAYLEDGTMVVVDNGRKLIGKNIVVTVTSVLQTTAGRMIFTKTKEDYEREELKPDNGVRKM